MDPGLLIAAEILEALIATNLAPIGRKPQNIGYQKNCYASIGKKAPKGRQDIDRIRN
jgi:hypothetical protein